MYEMITLSLMCWSLVTVRRSLTSRPPYRLPSVRQVAKPVRSKLMSGTFAVLRPTMPAKDVFAAFEFCKAFGDR